MCAALDRNDAPGEKAPVYGAPRPLAAQPGPILWLAGLLVAAHLVRFVLSPQGLGLSPEWDARLLDAFAVIPGRYAPGTEYPYANLLAAVLPTVGHVFLHGGFLHLFFNLVLLLQCAAPVAERLGGGSAERGFMPFLGVFFLSAIAGAWAYIALNPGALVPAVGASGAISGVFAAYLMALRRTWRLALSDPSVRAMGFWFLAINVGLAAVARVTGVFPIAWEAHLGGFIGGAIVYAALSARLAPGPWDR
jgi:membrane associated rhomboid family serine protease